ncbi:MAG TPA: hypothetical protein VFQ25_11555 [Ktedonobacterales bacterium]|nr:hypothetical protein [Ktedonobacterales bacterium]
MISGVFAKPGPGRSITDVYDAEDRRILVRFPKSLIITLSVAGVVAFALIGYLGYNSDSSVVGHFFQKAWPLFLWFSALVFALEIAVLRHPRLRRQLIEALIVTLLSMLFVGVTALFPNEVWDFLSKVLNIHIIIPDIGNSPWTYAILNFGIILVFWADTLRRWLRARRGSPAARILDLGIGTLEFGEEGDLPTLPELIAGDLIAGGVLVGLLALLFQANVIDPISQALQVGAHITTCTVSWPIGACVVGGTAADPPTLARIDIIQALIYLPLGFITLALTATAYAFRDASKDVSVTGEYGADTAVSAPEAGGGQALSTTVRAAGANAATGQRGTGRVRTSVVETIYEALRAPLQRRIRLVIDNLLLALRNVVWPIFILLGMFALGQASHNIAFYLRTQSNERNCLHMQGAALGLNCTDVATQISQGLQYGNLISAVALVAAAALAIIVALMMLVFSLRVASNLFRFLGVVTWIAALTLWIFSLALSVSNMLFNLIGLTLRQPFPLFGVSTTASLLIFLLACVALLLGQSRSARRRAASFAAR